MLRSEALPYVAKFECLGFGFPKTKPGLDTLADEFAAICGTKENAETLAKAIVQGCPRCPTPIEMRRIAVMKFPPADGKRKDELDLEGVMG